MAIDPASDSVQPDRNDKIKRNYVHPYLNEASLALPDVT